MTAGILLFLAVLCWPSRRALRQRSAAAGLTSRGRADLGGPASRGGAALGGAALVRGDTAVGSAPTGAAVLAGVDGLVGLDGLDESTAHRSPIPRWAAAALRRLRPARAGPVLPLLDAAAAALRTGLPTAEALEVAGGAVSDSMRRLVVEPILQAAREGRAVAPVWQKVARRVGDPDLAAVGRAWAISERTGAPLADALTAAAAVARARMTHGRRVDAATAGAHATSTLLTLLPLGGIGVGLVLGLSPVVLYGSPFAQASLGAGLVALLLGRAVVRRMVARVAEGR